MPFTPFSRFLAAARRQPVDHVPVVAAASDFYLAPLLGISDPDDPEAKLEMLVRGAEYFPDQPLLFVITPCAALHLNMLRQVDNRDAYFERPEDWLRVGRLYGARELTQIHIPDPSSCPEHMVMLQIIQWYYENIPPELVERFGYVKGLIRFENPFDRLAQNLGTEWFKFMYTDPAFVHDAMELFTEASLVGARSLAEEFGPPVWVMLAEDMPSMVGPEHYLEFVAPYHRRLFEAFPEAVKFMHNDGDAAHLIEVLPECGMDIWHMGPRVPIELAKAKIGARVALMGNLDPLRVMLQGSDEQFDAECRRIIEAGKPEGGFVFSTGGELSPGTDPERVRAMSRYAQQFGTYTS
ncbi:MAG: uroporphyrinogen decarboxylase family protein [Anaerolineae bacterium]